MKSDGDMDHICDCIRARLVVTDPCNPTTVEKQNVCLPLKRPEKFLINPNLPKH